jgi:hypothetical protein
VNTYGFISAKFPMEELVLGVIDVNCVKLNLLMQ